MACQQIFYEEPCSNELQDLMVRYMLFPLDFRQKTRLQSVARVEVSKVSKNSSRVLIGHAITGSCLGCRLSILFHPFSSLSCSCRICSVLLSASAHVINSCDITNIAGYSEAQRATTGNAGRISKRRMTSRSPLASEVLGLHSNEAINSHNLVFPRTIYLNRVE